VRELSLGSGGGSVQGTSAYSPIEANCRYLAFLPVQTKENFFRALDEWQSTIVLDVFNSSSSDTSSSTLFSIPISAIQLLFSTPSLLANNEIATLFDNAITTQFSSAQPNITSFGLNPLIVRLLSSPKAKRRTWALSQLPACARRPLSFDHWCDFGIGEQIQALYSGTGGTSQADRLEAMEALLRCGALSVEAIHQGLIEGKLDKDGEEHGQGGFMSMLSHLLGSPSEGQSCLFT
jgi:senataxin